ncbi:MAG: hypothetical protein L0027_02210 [Candidatus Rokubacteria bacterium]|nr:hypothetical protein [Candidatus Rokubacteria bacterium]
MKSGIPRLLELLAYGVERYRFPFRAISAAPRRLVVAAVLLGMLAGPADVAAQELTPHLPAWERYFDVSWEPFERRGQPYLSGYVVNRYGPEAVRVKLLVDSLDSSGQVVAQRVVWLQGTVPGSSRIYFEVPVPLPAAAYRVRIYASEFFQGALLHQSP